MGLLYVGVVFVGGFLFCSCCLSVFVCFCLFFGGSGFLLFGGVKGRGIALGRTPFSQRVYTSVEPSWF